MKLLAWDTSSKAGALAAIEWSPENRPTLVSELAINVDAQHSERMLWGIHQLLEAARWTLNDVDVFGVGVGPGSFTGLRIGITTARTLAQCQKKPLIGVSSLAALARPVALELARTAPKTLLITATDACKGELFALWGGVKAVSDCVAMADGDLPGLWKRGAYEKCVKPHELLKLLRVAFKGSGFSHWQVLGEARGRFSELWDELPKAKRWESETPFIDQVQGRFVALLAWEAFQAGLARTALSVHPRYLRVSDAELKLKAGLLPPGPTRGL